MGAIIIVMQRLHADDLVAHVQQHETWDVLSFPAIAEQDETYEIITPYGRKRFYRKRGDILEPALLSPTELETVRRAPSGIRSALACANIYVIKVVVPS